MRLTRTTERYTEPEAPDQVMAAGWTEGDQGKYGVSIEVPCPRSNQRVRRRRTTQSFVTHLALNEVSRRLHSGLSPDVSDGSDTDGGEAGDGREGLHFE